MTKEQIIEEFKSYAEDLVNKVNPVFSGGTISGMIDKVTSLKDNVEKIEQQLLLRANDYLVKYNIPGLKDALTQTATTELRKIGKKIGF